MVIRIDEIVENVKNIRVQSVEVEINVEDGMKKKRDCYVDVGISKYIKELNDWGYETCMSCSGMEWDNHDHELDFPSIFFVKPSHLKHKEMKYFDLLSQSLKRAGFAVEFQPSLKNIQWVIGYIYSRVSKDDGIDQKFRTLVNLLTKKDYFKKKKQKERCVYIP